MEQAFNSLDAQREAAEAYIQSQKHVGWTLVETRFDDGGFSGGNMERPALQRLLEQIEARPGGLRAGLQGGPRGRLSRSTTGSNGFSTV